MSGAESRFNDRVALVTGTGKPNGIGWATAKILGQEGAFVAAGVRTPEDAELLNARLAEEGISGMGIEIDLTNLDGWMSIKEKSEARLATIEAAAGKAVTDLVHVAGITHDDLAIRLSEDEWTEIDTVKNKGPFFLTMAAFRGLRKAKPGRVVSVSSVAGIHGHAGQANYVAANAAMIGWTKSLAREYDGKGLHFNAFAPGVVDTDMTRGKLTAEQWEALMDMIPSGEAYQPDEIAKGIVDLLASDKNGHVEVMDGGISAALEHPKS
jgi:3-oxoacyl-[acyl-carrier protein] reductase